MKKIIAAIRKYPIALVSIGLFILMLIVVPKFATTRNLANLFAQISYIGVSATGISYIFIGGGNDISTGAAMTMNGMLSGLIMAKIMTNEALIASMGEGGAATLAMVIGLIAILLMGAATGFLNGFFIAKLNVNPFMMTLVTQLIFKSVALWPTASKSITDIPDSFIAIGKTKLFGILPVSIFILFAFFIFGQLFLSRTAYGRKLFATGANAKAARLVGINTFSVTLKSWIFGGICNSVAAIILIGKLKVANPSMGNDLFLDIMCSAIIGGCSIFGGKGSVTGTAFGVLLMGLITNGLTLLDVPYQGTTVVKGLVILGAIILNTVQDKVAAKQMLASASQKHTEPKKEAA